MCWEIHELLNFFWCCFVVDAFDEKRMMETLQSMKEGHIVTVSDYDFLNHSP